MPSYPEVNPLLQRTARHARDFFPHFSGPHFPGLSFPFVHDVAHAGGSAFPELDICETNGGYWIDLALPGTTKPEVATIEWATTRELSIRGHITRLPFPDNKSGKDLGPKGAPADLNGISATPELPASYQRFVLQESSLGWFHRSITFPVDIDSDNVKAKLEAGLLRVWVPKARQNLDTKPKTVTVST